MHHPSYGIDIGSDTYGIINKDSWSYNDSNELVVTGNISRYEIKESYVFTGLKFYEQSNYYLDDTYTAKMIDGKDANVFGGRALRFFSGINDAISQDLCYKLNEKSVKPSFVFFGQE